MSRIYEDGGYNARDIALINRKRIVFIVDECHRDVFGEMMRKIKETFPMAMFFGFTGTPIYAENQKKLSTTVAELFVKKQKLRLAAGRSFCMQWCVDQNLAICSGVMEVTVATASLTVSSKS